jgi:hypothetical protein
MILLIVTVLSLNLIVYKRGFFGSAEIIVFHNVPGGINRRWKARIDWRNPINGFDMFAVPKGRANLRRCPSGHLRDVTEEHEKISFRKSSS